MSEDTETNPLRAMMVQNIIQQNPGVAFTVESLAKLLPDNFDLGDDDLAHYRESHPIDVPAEQPITFEGEPEATPAPEAIPPQAKAIAAANAEWATPESLPPPATADEIEAATVRRIAADQTIANARVAVIAAGNVERAARSKLAEAVTEFQSGFPKITREQLMRDMIRSEQERKAAGLTPQQRSRPGKSEIDRIAFYSRGGNPARGNFRRGASTIKGAPNYDPRRGPVVAQAKVPSDR